MKSIDQIMTTRNTMLATVITFLLLSFVISIGMLTPFFVRLATGVELSMDMQYFNGRTFLPTTLLALLLIMCLSMGLGVDKVLTISASAIALSAISLFISPFNNAITDLMAPFLVVALLVTFYRLFRATVLFGRSRNLRPMGAHVIHLGVILVLIGVIFSSGMKVEDSDVVSIDMVKGFEGQDYSVRVTDMDSRYEGSTYQDYPGSSYVTYIDFDVYKKGAYFDTGQVKYITDFKWGQTYTTTYIHRALTEELFIVPRALDESEGTVNLYVRTVPFITSLWAGIFLMAIGILILSFNGYVKANVAGSSLVSEGAGSNISRSELEKIYARKLENEIKRRK